MKYSVLLLSIICSLFYTTTYSQNCGHRNSSYQAGEKLTYKVGYSLAGKMITAGYAQFKVEEEFINSKKIYHLIGTGKTTPKFDNFFTVRDRYESWINPATLLPYRFKRNVNEGKTQINSEVKFNHRNKLAKSTFGTFRIPTCTQDVISALYWARTVDFASMNKGDKKYFKLFLDDELHEINIQYLGKEVIQTEYGKIRTLKLTPQLIAGTVFDPEDEMYVWVTDDQNRIPVKVSASILIGKVESLLVGYENLKNTSVLQN